MANVFPQGIFIPGWVTWALCRPLLCFFLHVFLQPQEVLLGQADVVLGLRDDLVLLVHCLDEVLKLVLLALQLVL